MLLLWLKNQGQMCWIVNLNEKDFEVGETVRGENLESLRCGWIANGDRDITDYYKLNTGQDNILWLFFYWKK